MYKFKDEINYINFFRFDKDLVRSKKWADLPKASKSIYPVLAVHTNATGFCFPSQETIAILSGITPKTVRTGIKGLWGLPGIKILRITTTRGHRHCTYKLDKTPDERGRSFALYKCIFEGGNWSQLTSSAHSLYIVMRTFAFFDPYDYLDLEGLEDCPTQDLFESDLYKNRKYDFVNSEIGIMAEHAGISRSATLEALEQLDEEKLIEETYSIDGYDTWKIFIKTDEYYKRSFLNEVTEKRYGSV